MTSPGRWPPRDAFFGLYIDAGHSLRGGVWLRPPHAELICRAGCEHYASGAAEVIRFLATLHTLHDPPPPGAAHERTPDGP
ncbi:hypothetical protein [Streptomyces sp. CAU 1734]|uniref:hypothetical protein n=1 Tax=Streptomyces sp. CAU 1734 TaxID=3140360 RepID=UPI003260E6B3